MWRINAFIRQNFFFFFFAGGTGGRGLLPPRKVIAASWPRSRLDFCNCALEQGKAALQGLLSCGWELEQPPWHCLGVHRQHLGVHLHKLPWPLGFILPPCSVPQAPH